MADLRSVYAAVDEPAALDALDAFFNQVGYEISQDIMVVAGKLGESQHVLQVIRVPSSIMRKFIYKSGRTQVCTGQETCP